MARYDRIAPLTSPSRDSVFPAWPALRDMEGQDRDADVCRRARLRFRALRPVRRVLDRAPQPISAESYNRQVTAVREELGSLSARDVERARITRFLRQIEDRDHDALVAALLEYAEQAHSAGHDHAAEEFALTAQGFRPGAAEPLLARIRGDLSGSDAPEDVIENGWNQLRQTDDPFRRARIVEDIGRALLALQMFTPAERCFAMISQRSADLTVRSRGRAAHALTAALTAHPGIFRERRASLLNDDAEWAPDPRVAASVHIDLAYGSLLIGDLDFAREHLRSAIKIARLRNYAAMLERAEGILTALEQNTEVLLRPLQFSTEAAQRIAAQIELLEIPTPAT